MNDQLRQTGDSPTGTLPNVPPHWEAWGDMLAGKTEQTLRIGLQNFGGFSAKADDPIDASLRRWITSNDFDIFGISEVNLYWHKVPAKLQLKERIRHWWESAVHSVRAFNTTRTQLSTLQWGGTAQLSKGSAANRVISSGQDSSGLGRWVWTQYRGKDNRLLRVVTGYRPCYKGTGGVFTVHAQHRAYFNSQKLNRKPRAALLDDLSQEISQWVDAGEHVILLMDCNEDVRSPTMKAFLEKCHLREAILEKHGKDAPATYKAGKAPIDGIFTTRSVTCTAAGYAAFDDGVQGLRSDHRCLWIDIDICSVFGHIMPPFERPAARRLKCSDPRTVDAFNVAYLSFLRQHKLHERAFALEAQATYPLPEHLQQEAERIDTLKVQGIWHADRLCRPLRLGGIPYSPEYKRLEDTVAAWNSLLQDHKGTKLSSRFLQRLLKKAGIITPLRTLRSLPLDSILDHRKTAYQQYRSFKKRARQTRDNWLEELAEARARDDLQRRQPSNSDHPNHPYHQHPRKSLKQATATQIRQLKSSENLRESSRRIKHALGKGSLGGITLVVAPNDQGQWMEHTTKADIELACREENIRRFSQTSSTPFMIPPLSIQFGYLGTGPNADAVLDGSFKCRPGTDPYASRLLQSLTYIDGVKTDPISQGIETKDFISGWHKCKERTSAGPSRIHFGHCRAMARDHSIASFEASMASIPMRSGYAYSRWRKCVDVEIMKKANSFRVDKLRTIVLFEADFNFCNKSSGRKVAQRSEAHHGHAPEQAGSRKGHRAIDQALNKRLTFDLLRQLKQAGVLCSNDMKSNYDRIVHSIASLCLRRQGLAESEVVCMFSTLQNLEHSIRTAYGDSDETYGREIWAAPMQGVYQGNGAGPTIWAVISSPLLQIMKEEGFGTFFRTSLSSTTIRLVGYAFVDDTDLVQTGTEGIESGLEILAQMQEGIKLWEGLITATGGALSVDKSTWWLLDFHWNEDGSWRYVTSDDLPAELVSRDHDGVTKPIPRLEPSQAFETLGVLLSPDGSQEAAFQHLLELSRQWADRIRASPLTKEDTLYALQATILKKLEYALPALSLTEAQCSKIMAPILHASLPKAGFNRHFPREVLYGPYGLLGFGLPSIHTSQTISHITHFLRHAPHDTVCGSLMRGSLEALKLEIGLPGSLFHQPYRKVGHLGTDCWIKHLWASLLPLNLQLDEQTPCLPLRRLHDQNLIESFLAAGYRNKLLHRLNRCRLRVKAVTLSDITSGDGRYLLPGISDGTNTSPTSFQFHWPNQGPLPSQDWTLWRQALKKCFGVQFSSSSLEAALPQPLGPWIDTPHPDWPSWFNPADSSLYVREGHLWCRYLPLPGFSHGFRHYHPSNTTDTLPLNLLRALCWTDHNRLIVTGWSTQLPPHPDAPTPSLDSELSWAVEYLELPSSTIPLAQALIDGSAISVADGSFKDAFGTSGFTIVPLNDFNARLLGANQSPGSPSDQCSYRSELCGIFGILVACRLLCQRHNIQTGSLVIACDNLAAGRHSLEYTYPVTPAHDHFDLLAAIHQLRNDLPIQFSYRHVEGHQRTKHPGRPLDQWARLNEEMDSLAKAFWHHSHLNSPRYPVQDREWALWTGPVKVCRKFAATLREHIHSARLHSWWLKKRKFSQRQISLFDTSATTRASRTLPTARRRWVSKFAAGYLPVGRNMKRWKFWRKNNCPRCLNADETTHHFLRCNDPRARQIRSDALTTFTQRLADLHTDPNILSLLCSHIRAWLCHSTPPLRSQVALDLLSALDSQTLLGWDQLLFGHLSSAWGPRQQLYFTEHRIRSTGTAWASKVIQALWDLSWTLWDHRNEVLHNSDVHNLLLDMDTIDLSIIEEWHAGYSSLHRLDQLQFKNQSLDELLARSSQYRREWLHYVTCARDAITPVDDS